MATHRTQRHPAHSRRRQTCLSRRDWLKLATAGVLGGSASGWLQTLAAQTADNPTRKRACILLWMPGGPSQLDTFDPKPEHENGGPVKPIHTTAPGVSISEYLPKLARQMQHVTVVRSMSTKEGDHGRATYLMRTGYLPQGPVQYPAIGAAISKELGHANSELPNFVSISPNRFLIPGAFGPGFLGPRHAPLVVGGDGNFIRRDDENSAQALRVRNLALPPDVTRQIADARLDLLTGLNDDFIATHPAVPSQSHVTAYQQAVRMMRSEAVKAFELDGEPDQLRDAYGRNQFGQSCLLARRLVERGVPFVEVSLNGVQGNGVFGWDTHQNNFEGVSALCGVLDPAWSTLIEDLRSRGLLDTTLVVWMGEFGRTPAINRQTGRDHFPAAWSTVLCGGGIRGGEVYGKTSDDGMTVADNPVTQHDLLATICHALGVDPMTQNMSNVGRPIRIVDPEAKPLMEILA